MNTKLKYISLFLLLICSVTAYSQKITLGSTVTKDGGQYKGELVGNKPYGKGTAV